MDSLLVELFVGLGFFSLFVAADVLCVRNHTQTHIHIHTSTSHTKAGPAQGRFKRLCVFI